MTTAIAFFGFNRPAHTRATLAALSACDLAREFDLLAFIDGPRDTRDFEANAAVILEFQRPLPFKSVEVFASPQNKGLYRSITEGVSAAFEQHTRVIVVEDDVVPAPHFLAYMQQALDRYQSNPRVGCIHGYAVPASGLPEFFFQRGGDCWGWATWRARWNLFRHEPVELVRALVQRNDLERFMAESGAGALGLLCDRALQRNQSWAIQWHASLWLEDRLTLQPGTSHVANIGNDGSGTHSGKESNNFSVELATGFQGFALANVEHDARSAKIVSAFYNRIFKPRYLPSRIWRALVSRRARAICSQARR